MGALNYEFYTKDFKYMLSFAWTPQLHWEIEIKPNKGSIGFVFSLLSEIKIGWTTRGM